MAVIKIKIFVPELTNVMSLFDQIEVQKSEAGTPYTDAVTITTNPVPTSAVLIGTLEGPFSGLQGQELRLKVDQGPEQSVVFTAADPISLSNVIAGFNTGITGATASDDGTGKLKIVSDTTGTSSVLEMTGGTALATLGFTIGDKDNGEDLRVALLVGVTNYEYDDQSGLATNYYRTRFINSVSGQVSSWSDWIMGNTGAAINATLLIVGTIKLAGVDGTAVVGQSVTIVNPQTGFVADGFFMSGKRLTFETDSTGQGQTTLVKGSTVDVVINGTSVIRRILVPSVGTEFNLLDPTIQTDDEFGIQTPDLPAAVRRS